MYKSYYQKHLEQFQVIMCTCRHLVCAVNVVYVIQSTATMDGLHFMLLAIPLPTEDFIHLHDAYFVQRYEKNRDLVDKEPKCKNVQIKFFQITCYYLSTKEIKERSNGN